MIADSTDKGMLSFKQLVSMLNTGKAHDPNYDVISTFIVVVIINLSTLMVFDQ